MGAGELSEDEYLETLGKERRRYAWVLERYLGKTAAAAHAEALRFYEYEPPDVANRGLVFHNDAWHWALLGLPGGSYWQTHPEWERPGDEYFDVE
ncbi:hypothetical protein [Nocardia callitridis]|uniref:Uncharacterized protein n=1 Tax=Nocardia callitridis TaxID=648753 RepID=A0ABP9L3E3_9NOCA